MSERETIQRDLETLVNEFYHSVRQIYTMLRKKHKRELLELARKKRKRRCARNTRAERADIPLDTFGYVNQLYNFRNI